MAYTFTRSAYTVFGNQNVQMGVVTADAASGVVSFGFGTIVHAQIAPQSSTTMGVRFHINGTAANVAAAGTLGVSGAVSGDEWLVTIYGRN